MRTFREFIGEGSEDLEEGVLRTGAIISHAAKSKSHGDKAVREFERGKQYLKGAPSANDTEARLTRIERAMGAMLDGLMHQRSQIGNAVSVNVSGHLLASRIFKKRAKR